MSVFTLLNSCTDTAAVPLTSTLPIGFLSEHEQMYRQHGVVITSLEIETVPTTTHFLEELKQLCLQNYINIGLITSRPLLTSVHESKHADKKDIPSLSSKKKMLG
jgi:hypothetical protein